MCALIRSDYIGSDNIGSDSPCTFPRQALVLLMAVLPVLLLGLLLVLLSSAVLGVGSASADQPAAGDTAPRIRNGATPAEGVETITLQELWRIGGDDEDSVLIGLIAQALVSDDGTIYLLDGQLNQIEVFSADGEHQGTIGREGSGPGEFRLALDMVFMPDGSIGVAQVFPGKLVQIDLAGNPAGEFKPHLSDAAEGGFLVLVNSLSNGGNLVLSGIDITFDQATLTQNRRYFVTSFGPDATPVTEYYAEERLWDFQNFTLRESMSDFLWSRLDVGDDGQVVAAIPRDEYVINVYAQDGSLELIIERDYEPWRRNERARARATALLEGQIRQFPPGTPYEISDTEPAVASLTVRDDGSIWVLTGRAMWEPKPQVLATYDVFDTSGQFVKQVDVRGEGKAWNDLLLFVSEDLLLRITGFHDGLIGTFGGISAEEDEDEEAEAMEVICYRIQ